MPIWLTIAIGLTGSIVGAVVGRAISGDDNGYVVSFLSFGVAIALVAAYRRFVQHRPIFGPGAMAFPSAASASRETRERLRCSASTRTRCAATPKQLEQARLEAMLRELHRAGVLDDDELQSKLGAFATVAQRRSSSHALGLAHHRRPHRRCARTGASSGQGPDAVAPHVRARRGLADHRRGDLLERRPRVHRRDRRRCRAARDLGALGAADGRGGTTAGARGRAGTSAWPSAPTRHRARSTSRPRSSRSSAP